MKTSWKTIVGALLIFGGLAALFNPNTSVKNGDSSAHRWEKWTATVVMVGLGAYLLRKGSQQ